MLLSNLTTPVKGATVLRGNPDLTGLTADSRAVQPGFAFVAVPGTEKDGRAFIGDALAKGAVALILPEGSDCSSVPPDIAVAFVPDMRPALSALAASFYPGQPAFIAAVTGTSGKTSTVQFTRELWSLLGHKAASIGTLGLITPEESKYGSLTTPDPITLHQHLHKTAAMGITHLAMETSSHGILLNRLDDVAFKIGAFTNLSRDHLDYHQTMEAYFDAKRLLFQRLLPADGTAVLNADIPEYETLVADCRTRGIKVIGFGAKGTDITLHKAQPVSGGQAIVFGAFGARHEILLPIMGDFQVMNSLCALGLIVGSGEDPARAVAMMEKLSGVPGRMQKIGLTASGGIVFVDYAHKPAGLENVLNGLRPHVLAHPGARLHIVFGCGGNRDKGKRPQMGAIAQRLADEVVVTDDNPRREVPAEIRKDILAGCTPGPHLTEIGDRAAAIHQAVAALKKDDVLVIAGKGHEVGQIVGDKVLPFDDADVARQAIAATHERGGL